jgi:hypothetical protein
VIVSSIINIYWDAQDDQWRVEFHEEPPGWRNLEFGPFAHPGEARNWIAQAISAPLPAPENWKKTEVPGLRVEYHCTIHNEVPA